MWIGLLEPSDERAASRPGAVRPQRSRHRGRGPAHQRPKLQRYGDSLFVVARTAEDRRRPDPVRRDPSVRRLRLRGLGPPRPVGLLQAGAGPCRDRPPLWRAASFILHAILDFIVDNYPGVLERVHEEAEEIEDDLLAEQLSQAEVRAALHPAPRPAAAALGRTAAGRGLPATRHSDVLPIDPDGAAVPRRHRPCPQRPGRDRRAARDLAFCFEASLLTSQSQQTTVIAPPRRLGRDPRRADRVAGVYGMNFEHMPELHLGIWLLSHDRPDRRHLRRALRQFPPPRLAVTCGRSAAKGGAMSDSTRR